MGIVAVKISAPAEIVREVPSCHTVEAAHPGFEPTAIGVDVLYVIDLGDNPDASGQIDWTMGNANFAGNSNHGPAAVGAQNGIAGQYGLERLKDVRSVVLLQNEVGCAAGANHDKSAQESVHRTSRAWRPCCHVCATFVALPASCP